MSRTVVFLLAFAAPAAALEILPKGVKYDPAVPHPDKVLGFAVGSRHLHHHQLMAYLRTLANSSPRVTIREYARSHGDRPLVLLTITSPDNHKKLDAIREQHAKLADPKRSADVAVDSLPAVIVMGYGVHGTAIPWLNARKVIALRGADKEGTFARRPYAAMEEDAAERLISGAIFKTRPDATHPVCWGLEEGATLPVFRNNRVILEERVGEPYNTPVLYDESPLLSGYVSKANLARLAGSASVAVAPVGSGRAILFAANPNFRSFWHGTSRLFVNALFFGPVTRTEPARAR